MNTVETHLPNFFAKLGAHSSTHAIGRAKIMGLLGSQQRLLLPRDLAGAYRVAGSPPAGVAGVRLRASTYGGRVSGASSACAFDGGFICRTAK